MICNIYIHIYIYMIAGPVPKCGRLPELGRAWCRRWVLGVSVSRFSRRDFKGGQNVEDFKNA